MTQPYCLEADGCASAIPIALWTSDFEASGETGFKLTFAPVAGAYVACVSVSKGRTSSAIRTSDFCYGRTNTAGWVLLRELDQLGEPDDVPPAPRVLGPAPALWFLSGEDPVTFVPGNQADEPALLNGLPNEGYRIFWTYDKGLFETFVAELEREPHAALVEWGARLYLMEPFGDPAPVGALDLLDQVQRKTVSRLLLPGERAGYHSGWHFEDRRTTAIFDATPDSFRALHRAEFLARYASAAVQRSGKDLAVLYRARGMIDAARDGAPEADFEASLWCDRQDPMNSAGQFLWCDDPETAKRQHRAFDKYRLYAWRCATGGVIKPTFMQSLPTSPDEIRGEDRQWRKTALKIANDTKALHGEQAAARHPEFYSSIPKDDLMLGTVGLKAVLAYYDLYLFGADLKAATPGPSFLASFEACRSGWNGLPEKVAQTCRELLSESGYTRFWRELSTCSRDAAEMGRRYERFLEAAAAADYPWWNVLAEQGAKRSFWLQLTPTGKLLGAALKSQGKTLSALVEARLATHTLAFQAAQDLMEGVFRQEILLSGQTVDPAVHYLERPNSSLPNYRALVDVRDGQVTVSREHPDDVAANRKFRFELLRQRKPDASTTSTPSAPGGQAYALADDLSDHYSKNLVVPVDLAELKRRHAGLPKAFQLCAETVNLATAVGVVVQTLQKDMNCKDLLVPTFDVAKGLVGVLDSYQAAIKALKPPIEPSTFLKTSPEGGLKLATRVMGGVDGCVKISKGVKILFSEDGDFAYELRQGRETRAYVQGAKGALQIAVGVVGVMGALPATAALVGGPVGLAIVIGGALVVAGVDQVLDASKKYEEHIDDFERALDSARRSELLNGSLRVVDTVGRAMNALAGEKPS